jgi:hypothetical protein
MSVLFPATGHVISCVVVPFAREDCYEIQAPAVSFHSSVPELDEGFTWAKKQAMAYVFLGDPVGDWYESSLPGREAFCMRDVSHQSAGARILGLQALTLNMFRHFARNISVTRDWCTFWEIDKYGRPCADDYRDDSSFWYNLPANFDMLQACFREYLWTGTAAYVEEPVFRHFYNATVGSYVSTWDKDGDGIPEHRAAYGTRGLGSYNEGGHGKSALMGADLVALQYAAYGGYGAFMEREGNTAAAQDFKRRAAGLKHSYNSQWWDAERRRMRSLKIAGDTFSDRDIPEAQIFPLLCGIIEDGEKTDRTLQGLIDAPRPNVEARSYFPEIWYRYGRGEAGFQEMMALCDPALDRREYPEVSFSVLGSIASGMMGIDVDARERTVTTLSRLTAAVAWARMEIVPVLDSFITVRHEGVNATVCENISGPPHFWRACFPCRTDCLIVDGRRTPADTLPGPNGQETSSVLLRMGRDSKRTVALP